MKEIEIRYELTNQQFELISSCLKKNCVAYIVENEKDLYFCDSKFIFDSDNRPYIVRIRKCKNNNRLTFKSFTDNKGAWLEEETQIDNPDGVQKILERLNQKLFLIIEKNRISFHIKNIEINLDDIKNLGLFVELELQGENVREGRTVLKTFLEQFLDIDENKIIYEGYVQLMEKTR